MGFDVHTCVYATTLFVVSTRSNVTYACSHVTSVLSHMTCIDSNVESFPLYVLLAPSPHSIPPPLIPSQLPTLLQESSTLMTPLQLDQWRTKLQAFCDEHNATSPTFFLPLHMPIVQLAARISTLISLPHSCSTVLLAGVDNPEPMVQMVGLSSGVDVVRPSQLPRMLPSSTSPGDNKTGQAYPARLTLPNFRQALKSVYTIAGTKVSTYSKVH